MYDYEAEWFIFVAKVTWLKSTHLSLKEKKKKKAREIFN